MVYQGQIIDLSSNTRWARLAKIAFQDDLFIQRRRITKAVLRDTLAHQEPRVQVSEWAAHTLRRPSATRHGNARCAA